MTPLVVTRRLAVPPASAWDHVVNPARMNKWSSARIELVSAGDGARYDGVGTYRKVHLPGPGRRILKEVVQHSAPPHRMVYRVFDTPGVKHHRGEITLDDADDGARLTWTVDFETAAGTSLVRRFLRRELERSVDTLANRVTNDPAVAPTLLPQLDDEPTAELRRTAEAVLGDQTERADRMFEAQDPKRWFMRVYQFVTEAQLAWMDAGEVVHRGWVLALIPVFHRLYVDALDAFVRGVRPEPHWAAAFETMERTEDENRAMNLGLLKAVRAHIEEDLPLALAEVWAARYRGRCDYARFRADYLRMGSIFENATERLTSIMPIRRRDRLLGAMLPKDKQYDVPRRRREAFERGGRIAKLLNAHPCDPS